MTDFFYDDIKAVTVNIPANGNYGEAVIKGAPGYKNLVGFMIAHNEDTANSIIQAKVSVTTSQGFILLPSVPFVAVRPSILGGKLEDKVIKMSNIKADEQDFRLRVEHSSASEANFTFIAFFSRK